MASSLLFLNLIMYVVVAIIAGWVINYGIDESRNSRKCHRSPPPPPRVKCVRGK